MTKLKIFFAIAAVFIGGVFWVNTQSKLAKQACLMAGGQWSVTENSCDQ